MDEDDIRAFMSWRHCEPNFQEDCLRDTAMDYILSNCFVQSLRVQNLFDTKARPRKPQRDLPQAQPQNQSNVYIPGGRMLIECPHRSELNAKEHREYLRLYLAYKCKGKNALQKQEENMFNFLHQKIVQENIQYEEFVHALTSKTQQDVCSLQDSIRIYTSQAWQFRLAEVHEYPALYKVIATLPLVSSLDGSLVRLKLENTVMELGEPAGIFPPQFKSKLCCSGEYDSMCHDYPIKTSVKKMCPVSRDSTAEKLAVTHNADIVISSSALQHIADNSPNYDKVWDIPVVIKELECEVGSGNMKKITFIDKALPPTTLTAEQRNIWFHKIVLKKFFCSQDDNVSAKCPAKRPSYITKKHKVINCTNNLHTKASSVQKVNNFSVSSVLSHASSDASEGDDDIAVEDTSVNGNSSESVFQAEAREDARLSNNMNELNLTSDGAMFQRGVKRKPVDTTRGSDADSDCDDVSNGSSSDNEGKLMIACDDGSICDEQEKEKNSVHRTSAVKKKRKPSFGNSNGVLPTSQGVMENEAGRLDEAVLSKPSDQNCSLPHQEEMSAMKDKPMIPSCTQQKNETMLGSSVEPVSQPHIVYNMWELCLQECEKEDLKERFLKKKIKNKHLRILVRCKVDGVMTVEGKLQKMCIVPKLEHKTEYGAERLSPSEMIRSWVTLFFRPGVNLARVRVDAKSSEVLMFEETNLKELMEYASFSKFPVQSTALGTLYNVLTALESYKAGAYLMSHRRDSFFNFLQADDENGRHNLKTVYQINCNEVSTSRHFQYLPIDPSVVMPRNVICGRVPGTFNPKKDDTKVKKNKNKYNK